MSILDNIKPNQVSADLTMYKHLIAGRPKSGKTSLFYNIIKQKHDGDLSKGLLVAFEKGYQALNGIHAYDVEEWEDFQELVEELVDNKDEVPYKMIALDTIDVLISRATSYMLARESIKAKKRFDAVNDLAYGKGYELLERTVADEIDKLDQAGYSLFFITHDKDRTYTQKDGLEYDKTIISAGGRAGEYFKNSADMIHFIDIVKEVEDGKKVDKRYIYFRSDGQLEAGSRFPNIVEKVEYSTENFIEAIEDAIRAEYDGDQKAVDKAKKSQVEEIKKEDAKESDVTAESLIAEIDEKLTEVTVAKKKELAKKLKEGFTNANYRNMEDVKELEKVVKLVDKL